jgi:DNA-binding FadR family transcriptional regulator
MYRKQSRRVVTNRVVRAVLSAVAAAFDGEITEQIAESRAESLRQPGRPTQSLSHHERIADAIRRGTTPRLLPPRCTVTSTT